MANNKHYLIRRTNIKTGRVDYKRYKCIEDWHVDPNLCWKFSRSGANGIVRDLEKWEGLKKNHLTGRCTYDLVATDQTYSGR